MYTFLRIGTRILPWVPAWLRAILGILAGTIAWCVARKAREQARANMLHVLGKDCLQTWSGRRKLQRTVRRMFQHNARNYIELCALSRVTEATLERTFHIKALENLDKALAKGKGVVLFSAHYGPFDYMVQYAAVKGYPVTVPVEQLADERLLDLILQQRRSHGIKFIPLGNSSAMRTILQELKSNHIVLITADRAVQGQSAAVPFFDAPAQLPVGPAMLAQRTGATLIGAFGWRTSLTQAHATCVPVSEDMTEEERKDTHKVMRKIAEKMEHFIKAHPEQWLVFAPVWQEAE